MMNRGPFLIALMGSVAFGAAPPDPSLRARLNADALDERESGERELSEGASGGVDDLLALLASGELDPEAHRRVARAAFALFSSTPRAGMGVEFDTQRQVERGVPIADTVENFPAFELIEPGDVILSAQGVELDSSALLGRIIVAHDPGDVIELRVLREGEPITLRVPLGSFSALGQRVPLDRLRLIDAFELRCAWAGVRDRAIAGAIGGGLSVDDWAVAAIGTGGASDPGATPRGGGRAGAERPVPGGLPRTFAPPPSELNPRTLTPSSAPSARNLDVLARRLGELAKQRARLRARLESGEEPEATREKVRQTIAELDTRIDQMLSQMRPDDGP